MAPDTRNLSSNQTAKAHNLRLLLPVLLREQPITRPRLAQLAGLSPTSVKRLTADLMTQGILVESRPAAQLGFTRPGRIPVSLQVAASCRHAVGVHIGARVARIVIIDAHARTCSLREVEYHREELVNTKLAQIVDQVRAMLVESHAHVPAESLVGVGVVATGLVENKAGVNVFAPHLDWRNVAIQQAFAQALDLPVAVDHYVGCMALAESLYGLGRHTQALSFVYARVGVGAGLVINGAVHRGAGQASGEIGHWCMVPTGGELCHCGNRGCLETLISETALLRLAHEIDADYMAGQAQSLAAVFSAARAGHSGMLELVDDRATYVGLALANLVNILSPQLIVLGGWLYDAFDLIVPVVERTLRKHAYGGSGDHIQLLPASFGRHSGEIGAAVMAFDQLFYASLAAA